MRIQERIQEIYPNADVYWTSSTMHLTLIFPSEDKIDTNEIKTKTVSILDKAGLLRAVSSIHIIQS